MSALARQLCSVFKLRIGVMITLSALAGLAVTPGPAPAAWQVLVLGLAVLIASASAGALNQYLERDLDARMRRTRERPFVTGQFAPSRAWLFAIGVLLVAAIAAAALALNALVALYVFLGAFVYGVIYTLWLKRRTWTNVVWGGLSGSFAVLAGAAAVDPSPAPVPLILAVVLFLWTPPHFWSLATALSEDYRAAGVPMLPVVVGDAAAARVILLSALALVAVSLAPAFFGLGWIYLTGALAGGAYFVHKCVRLARDPCPGTAMAAFFASLIQLGLVLLAAVVDASLAGSGA